MVLRKLKMSDVLVVVSKVIWQGIVGKALLETVFSPERIQKEGPSMQKVWHRLALD